MGMAFWVRRFFTVLAAAFALIAAVQLLKGHPVAHAVSEALLWATVSAAIFVGARLLQSRRGHHCALCGDTPEMRKPPPG